MISNTLFSTANPISRTVLVYLLLFSSVNVVAQNNVFRAGITLDQDFFIEKVGLRNNDQNYTMGFGIFLSNTKWANTWAFWPARSLGKVFSNKRKFVDANSIQENASFQAGVTAFTPLYLGDNVDDSLYYMVNDRPFSCLAFLSTKYHKSNNIRMETTQLVIGVLGTGIAREVQTYIHKNHWFGSERAIPDGWKYQISDGGELTALISRKVDKLINRNSNSSPSRRPLAQFIYSNEIRVGYYTDAMLGLAVRFGVLDPSNWVNYDNFQLNYASGFVKDERKFRNELYILASVKPRLVLYNGLLMGQFKDNFHVFDGGDINRVVAEGFAGIGITFTTRPKNFSGSLLLYLSGRTPEFKTDLSNRWHIWGGIQLLVSIINTSKK